MTPQTFYLSWSDGVCRMAHGSTLDDAEEDAECSSMVTNRMSCSILNHNYTLVSRVVHRNGQYVTERV